MEQLHDQLQESLQELVTSDDWQKALEVAARFHEYSFANTRLIWAQAHARGFTPTRVAGYRAWQQMGRQVRRGERGLQILAPIIRNVAPEDSDDEERRVVAYRVVHVFDLAQTQGEPLAEVNPDLVQGGLPAHWDQVARLIGNAGFRLEVADFPRLGEANGITDWLQREVVVRAGLPGAQRFKTAIHELAHIRLHEPSSEERPSCRGVVEVEAESVAYMVCAALGIDSAGYSLPYVATWSGGDITKVTATANRVIGCARGVLSELEQVQQLQHEPKTSTVVAERDSAQREPALREQPARPDLEEILNAATDFYRDQLEGPRGQEAIRFLESRGIEEESIGTWRLGYAPASWGSLTAFLLKQGFSEELMIEAGVVGTARTGRLYDRLRNRVVFPVLDPATRPRGFAGRLLEGDGPKYLNSPETELYKKRSLLYGLHLAEKSIRDGDRAIVVEGYLDVIACHQAGLTNAVATSGTALTPEHLNALDRIATSATLAFDGDQAGGLAISRTAEIAGGNSIRLYVAHLPEGQDPAGLLPGNRALLEQALAEAEPVEHQLITEAIRRYDLDTPEGVVRAIYRAGEVITRIQDSVDRDPAIAYLAEQVSRSKSLVRAALAERPSLSRTPDRAATARGL